MEYPEHEFVIGYEELEEIGIETMTPTDQQFDLMDSLMPYLGNTTIIGQLEEVKP